jgi:methionyl-tRNA formyltransferase
MMSLRLAFAGTPDFAARHLAALLETRHEVVGILTQPDRPSGRGREPRPSPVKALAREHGLHVMQPATLRSDEAVGSLARLELDALVVVAYGLILPQAVLDLPRYGCINVHGSLLPRWRGAAPIQRSIEAGDDESGVSIMAMDAGLDTGPVLATASCPIAPLATSGDLYAELAELGPQLLAEVLGDLPTFLAAARAQDDNAATYAAKIDKHEAELDWTQAASVLARRVRAFNPAPGCFSYLGSERVKIWRARPRPGAAAAAPGTITACTDSGIAVRCGDGELLLEELQFPGARALPVADLLRGQAGRIVIGSRFAAP